MKKTFLGIIGSMFILPVYSQHSIKGTIINSENAVMPALNPGEFFGKIDRMSDVSAMPTTDSVSSPITSSEGTTVGIQRAAGEQVDQEVVEEESISEECVFAENVESNIEE